jgi:hypothetical protein
MAKVTLTNSYRQSPLIKETKSFVSSLFLYAQDNSSCFFNEKGLGEKEKEKEKEIRLFLIST